VGWGEDASRNQIVLILLLRPDEFDTMKLSVRIQERGKDYFGKLE
jgi:hypothetical protein